LVSFFATNGESRGFSGRLISGSHAPRGNAKKEALPLNYIDARAREREKVGFSGRDRTRSAMLPLEAAL
jgi:hypothetical protein